AFRDEGRQPVLRLKMPDSDLAWDDLVRGEVRFAAGSVPDFVLVRGNGVPLYPFVNPLDDALMGITDVLRGEDLLPSTPRQIALYAALTDIGVAQGTPRFGHLPYVTGEGSKKLSKRDPQSNLDIYRERGFLPEGFANYLALLGWSIAEDRDIFSMAEMVEAFDVTRVSANPARFDVKKAEAINATHLRALPVEEFIDRVIPYLASAGLVSEPPTAAPRRILEVIAPMAQEPMIVLSAAPCARRCTSRSSSWAGNARCPGWPPRAPWPGTRRVPRPDDRVGARARHRGLRGAAADAPPRAVAGRSCAARPRRRALGAG